MWSSFVAIGDSFTEGMADELDSAGRHRGWADRVANHLAQTDPDFRYANLAIRGKLLAQIDIEQAPIAAAMRADLVSIAGGVNDAMRRDFDLNRSATHLERAVRQIKAAGSDIVLFSFGDPGRRSSVLGALRQRLWALNGATREIAAAYGCQLVDFWGLAVFDDDALWDEDRLHLSPVGHRIVTGAVLEALGMAQGDWRNPRPIHASALATRARSNVTWAFRHGLPWVGRRIQGRSTGEGLAPKRPVLAPYTSASALD
jgi:lysophospholipase L1-like esterase